MNAQHLPGHPNLAQVLDDAGRQGFGKFNQTVLFEHPNTSDLTGLQPGLIGNGPHQVAGFGAMGFAHFNPEGLKATRAGA